MAMWNWSFKMIHLSARHVFSILMAFLVVCTTGCVRHVKPYKQKKRTYELPVPHAAYDAANSSGSLFDPRGIGSRLVTDARAQTVNDVVIVVIDEQATARRDASTQAIRNEERSAQLTSFLGMIAKLQKEYPDFDGATAMQLSNESPMVGRRAVLTNCMYGTLDGKTSIAKWYLVYRRTPSRLVNEEEHHFISAGGFDPRH